VELDATRSVGVFLISFRILGRLVECTCLFQDLAKAKATVVELKQNIEEYEQEIRNLKAAVAAGEATKSAEGATTDKRVMELSQNLEDVSSNQ
jgi:phage shock protein A